MSLPRRIRITFAASTLNVGGAEHVLAALLERLNGARFESELVLLKEPGTIGRRLLDGGIAGIHSLQRHGRDPRVLRPLVGQLRRTRPDILFALDHHNVILWGSVASVLAGVPSRVIASHTTGRLNGKGSFGASDRFWIRSSASVIALSASHARYLSDVEGVPRSKIVIIENGIDVTRFDQVDEGRLSALRDALDLRGTGPVVIMVAVMRPEKAHDAAVECARRLRKRYPALRLLFAGDGPERPRLEELVRRLEVKDTVRFLGERSDVAYLLHLSDVLILPSHGAVETLPLAVLESMAAGVPVVASRVGSVPDVIDDRVNGRLIEPADVHGLEVAISDILDKSQETAQLIRHARETVGQRYEIESMITRYEALFESLVRF